MRVAWEMRVTVLKGWLGRCEGGVGDVSYCLERVAWEM